MKLNSTTPIWLMSIGLLVAGCTSTRYTSWPEPRPLGNEIVAFLPPGDDVVDPLPSTPAIAIQEILTLEEALSRALMDNPGLQAFAWAVRAKDAAALQASLIPNPEIGAEIEEFAGTGALSGTTAAEITVALSQLIELGGDRRFRQRLAEQNRDLAGWDYEASRLDVFTETVEAFTEVLAAQERLGITENLLALADTFVTTVRDRADAGKVSELEATRAGLVRSNALIKRERALRMLDAARMRLSTALGSRSPSFKQVEGGFLMIEPVPSLEEFINQVERNPDLARWDTEMMARNVEFDLERARRTPDLVFSLGQRYLRELGVSALVADISIPLPVFDRNQGAIRQAQYNIRQAEALREDARLHVEKMLAESYAELLSAYQEAITLEAEILPVARELYESTQAGYREGKFDLLSVLDAQRTLFEASGQHLEAVLNYHLARTGVERLIGIPLGNVSDQQERQK